MRKPVEVLLLNAIDEKECRSAFEKELQYLSEKKRLQLWHRGKIGAHAREEDQFQQALDRADIVVLLLSPGLIADHEKELKKILDLLAAKQVEVFGLPIRPIDPKAFKGLSNLPVFQGWRQPLYVAKEMDSRTFSAMVQYLRQAILHVYDHPEYLTFVDLQDRLKLLLHQRGFLRFSHLMEQLLVVSPALYALKDLREQYLKSHQFSPAKSLSFYPHVWYQQLDRVLEKWIFELHPSDLIPNWKEAFPTWCLQLNGQAHFASSVVFPLFDSEKSLQIPIGLSQTEAAVCQKRYDSFCQALCTDQYDQAWDIAEQLWNDAPVTDKSWYEYRLLGLWAAKGADQIIREALHGGNTLKMLCYFDQNLQQLPHQSDLPAYNHALIGKELARALMQLYQNNLQEGTANKDLLEKLLELHVDIHRHFESASGFLEYATQELLGMGYAKWIRPVKVASEGWYLEDLQGYNARNALGNLFQEMVRDYMRITDTSMANKAWDNLLTKLRLNYENLCVQILEKGEAFESFRGAMVDLLQTAQIAFTASTDPRFLDVLIEELSDGALPWFGFDEQGKMIPYHGIQFDALTHLRHALRLRGEQDAGIHTKIERIRKGVYHSAHLQLKRQCNDLKSSMEEQMRVMSAFRMKQDGLIEDWTLSRGIAPTEESIHNLSIALDANRLALFDCLEKWYHLYLVDQNGYCIDELLKELSGSSLVLWFDLYQSQLYPYGPCKRLDIPVQELVDKALAIKPEQRASFEKQAADNLYRLEVAPIYEKITNGKEAQRYRLPGIISRCISCFALTRNEKYYNLVYQELVEERKFKWLDIDLQAKTLSNGAYDTNLGFDALGHLRQLLQLKGKDAQKGESQVLQSILNKRHAELLKRYRRDINVYPANNNIHDREMVANMIRTCLVYYEVIENEKWLHIPINELLEKGKINWFKATGKNGEHPENLLLSEPFNSREIKTQVQALASQYPGLVHRREGFKVLGMRL
ncbi:MAG TPA: hypothetical protein PKA00_11725 [Saprospiraceae bacterium]|nr:hypothetical protein [Saprospiraceae bacterium]HMQ83573.1 hypothetical protein [Saprospiraceae bacterium]